MNFFRKIGRGLTSLIGAAWAAFDIRDVFFLSGQSMLGYGLYLKWGLWLALIVGGVLMMATGYIMRGGR